MVRRSGTRCQMNSEIQRVTLTVSNSSLKQSCSVSTNVTSALEVNSNNMRYINLHFTYFLLTRVTGITVLYLADIFTEKLPKFLANDGSRSRWCNHFLLSSSSALFSFSLISSQHFFFSVTFKILKTRSCT